MSRIGKAPVVLPAGVTAKVENNVVTVKGPKGELRQEFHSDLTVKVEENHIVVDPQHGCRSIGRLQEGNGVGRCRLPCGSAGSGA